MFCKKFKMLVCAIALATTVAFVGSARAATIFQDAGPLSFDGLAGTVVTLPTTPSSWVTGGVHLEFDTNSSAQKYLWASELGTNEWYLDVVGGEGRVRLFGASSYVASVPVGAANAAGFHTISFDFVSGGDMELKVDGVSAGATPSLVVADYSPTADHHLGFFNVADGGYVGNMRNVLVFEGTPVPEASAISLLAIGLLVCAWRKRR